jgi:hypothetical protein
MSPDRPEGTRKPAPTSLATIRFSPAVLSKARGYLLARRVTKDPDAEGVWWCQGSADEPYRILTDADPVKRSASWIACSCPHGTHQGAGWARCAHAVAVLVTVRDGHAFS